MTEKTPAMAHRYPLMAPAPEGVDDAIGDVMRAHQAELDEALAPFGVALEDLLQPTWMRVVHFEDVEPFTPFPDAEIKHVEADPREVAEVVRNLLAGGDFECCASGEACSSTACTGSLPAHRGIDFGDVSDRAPMMGTADRGQWGDH